MRRSSPITWEEVRVGALILAALALLATGVFLVGEVGHVFGDRYRLVTFMRSGAGLVPGSAVQLAGQNVGQVERIEWIAPEERSEREAAVAVWMGVNREVREQIRTDSKAVLRTQGLLGDRVVDIEPGSTDARVLSSGDTLPAADPLDYQQILEQASGAVSGLSRLTRRLEEITRRALAGEGSLGRLITDETLYRRLTSLSGSMSRVLDRAAGGEGSLGKLLADDRLYERMVAVTASLDTVMGGVASGRGTLGKLAVSDSLYRQARSAAGRADSLLRRLEEGEGSAGRLLTEDELYEQLLKALTDVNTLLADLRDRPDRYVPRVEVF